MRGICGYGRYNDDIHHIGCPRAQSDMTPCIARDGALALDDAKCVWCGQQPSSLLNELRNAGVKIVDIPDDPKKAADMLETVVRLEADPAKTERAKIEE